MQKIKLNKDLFQLVLSGKKTATTRKGLKTYTLGKALFVNPENESETIEIEIDHVNKVIWGRLKYIESKLYFFEGYKSQFSFINAIEKIYGEINNYQEMTVIHFELINSTHSSQKDN